MKDSGLIEVERDIQLDLFFILNRNSSLPIDRKRKAIGVIIPKNIIPRTIGRIIMPNKYPKIIQILFKGSKSLGFKTEIVNKAIVRNKNIKNHVRDSFIKKYTARTKKINEKK